ncbi:uncharacterized protein ARMOST_17439 [Armillaria ostoyae]|uniref:Uncharacterized protein n=1 Tax=Armillaria ostoyae TaxID=47428 RepID=A0A284RZ13_ARMOS|nr:uncharacterized protein ARMOST_17439 [Armillaria ostoyae]
MTARTYPRTDTPDLTDSQIKDIFFNLDTEFNDVKLAAFLYGIYTGVVAVTLWAVASRNNCRNYQRPHFLVFIILLLYFLTAFNLYHGWARCIANFITPWKYFWEAIESTPPNSTLVTLTMGINAILSAVLADATLIWRCWIARLWIHKPDDLLISININLASRGIVAYSTAFGSFEIISLRTIYLENAVNWAMLYSSLVMATLLWCTILIVYRILRVGGAAGRIHVYQRVTEMLIESASLYSAVIIVLLVFEARNEVTAVYIQDLAIAMRGIMPTLLVGRVAAGHARPDDSWSESTPRSSLRFRNNSSSHDESQMSVGSGWDTSSRVRPDVEEGLEVSTEVQVERAAPTASTHDFSTPVVGTSSSVDYSVV